MKKKNTQWRPYWSSGLNYKTGWKEFVGRSPLNLAGTQSILLCRISSNIPIYTHYKEILFGIPFPHPSKEISFHYNIIKLLESLPYPIASGSPLRVDEEISWSHKQWTGFQFNSLHADHRFILGQWCSTV